MTFLLCRLHALGLFSYTLSSLSFFLPSFSKTMFARRCVAFSSPGVFAASHIQHRTPIRPANGPSTLPPDVQLKLDGDRLQALSFVERENLRRREAFFVPFPAATAHHREARFNAHQFPAAWEEAPAPRFA